MNLERVHIEGEELSDKSEFAIHTFKFHQLTVWNDWNDWGSPNVILIRVRGKVEFRIYTRCVKHGNLYYTMELSSEETGMDAFECIKKGIQSILEHGYDFNMDVCDPTCNCHPKYFKMVYDFSDVTDQRWRETLEQIFNTSNWTIQKQIK